MKDPLLFSFVFLALGLAIGSVSAWLIAKFRWQSQALPPEELARRYVSKDLHEAILRQTGLAQDQIRELEAELRLSNRDLAARDQELRHMDEKLADQKEALEKLQERFQQEFERVATRLLEEKSQTFAHQNQEQLHSLLHPLREHIKSFEEGIEKRFVEETRDRVSLKKEIEQLRELNQQLSQDANNLAYALKGGQKTQGDWGEIQLEILLQKAGLSKGLHYDAQSSFADEEGKQKRPDFIIHLPEEKHLIIDSKVSLTAYERYCSASEAADRDKAAKEHLESLRRHIRDLSGKNYQQLGRLHPPDYLMLFIPIEPAFALAIQTDQRLFTEALERNIVLVTTSTLLATMRTVSFIWKQEKQKNNVLEIARQSGLLYDKFVAFVDDLKSIGARLDQAQGAFKDAMNKLQDSPRFGDTLIGRAERIRELGAKASKKLPKELLGPADEPEEAESSSLSDT